MLSTLAIPDEQKALLDQLVENRAKLFYRGKEEPLVAASGVKCNNTMAMVSIKVPSKTRFLARVS